MAENKSFVLKNLTTIPSLSGNNYFVLSDGSSSPATNIIAYKTTLSDLASFIGQQGLVPPVILTDKDAYITSHSTLTLSGTLATLSSPADHAALQVGDIIIFADYPTTVVQYKYAFPNIGVLPSVDIPTGVIFYYGKAAIITKNSSGSIMNTISSGGITSKGSLIVYRFAHLAEASYFNSGGLSIVGEAFVTDAVRCSTYTSYPTVGYSDIRSADDTYIVQRNVDDGMVTYYHRPFLNATMTVSQPITAGVWTPVAFTVTNGTDVQNTTHQRNVVGSPSYDATNYAFPIPYNTDYPAAAYLINVAIAVEITAKTNNLFFLSIYSGPTATGDTLILAEMYHTMSFAVSSRPYCFDVCRTVFLRPLANINHRWIRVKVWLSTGGGNSATILSASENTFFNVVCLG